MSYERNQSSKPFFENPKKVAITSIATLVGATALYFGIKETESSDPNTANYAVVAKETLAQDISMGQKVDIAKVNLIFGNTNIYDPVVITLQTGNTFAIGFEDGTKNNSNMNQFQLANNEVAIQISGPIANLKSGVKVGFDNNGQSINEANGQVIASAQIN